MRPTDLRPLIRSIPDFPVAGVTFRDVTPLIADPDGLRRAVELTDLRGRDRLAAPAHALLGF